MTSDDAAPRALRAAVRIVWLESVALVAAAVLLLVKAATGHPDSVGRAVFGAALALFGAAVLAVGARGLAAARPAARTPVVMLQLLALPVGFSLGLQAGRIGYGGPILLAALAVLYLLFTPPVRAALDGSATDQVQRG